MRMIHVLRKPLSEGTVAANTLKHGTGGLNIDAVRVAHGSDVNLDAVQRQQSAGGGSVGNHFGAGSLVGSEIPTYKPGGRWPANVILQHLDGCRCDGIKRVPSNGNFPAQQKTASWKMSSKGKALTPDRTYREGGGETVANWVCEPGCPVARLDEQSGERPVSGAAKKGIRGTAYCEGDGVYYQNKGMGVVHNDTGGASRFYKQIGGGKVPE